MRAFTSCLGCPEKKPGEAELLLPHTTASPGQAISIALVFGLLKKITRFFTGKERINIVERAKSHGIPGLDRSTSDVR